MARLMTHNSFKYLLINQGRVKISGIAASSYTICPQYAHEVQKAIQKEGNAPICVLSIIKCKISCNMQGFFHII